MSLADVFGLLRGGELKKLSVPRCLNLLAGNMADQDKEQVRCSSSESDNFEKIDSEEARGDGETHFRVGDESPEDDDGPAHEGGDFFPNAPPPNIRRMLTPAQQLALAEKRSTLRVSYRVT
ncbi:unnamed protein product [Colias eurytheme]|nr:unnamed protein product [Colias eurytheme]